ncbi:ABC transporter permease [Actinosynnema pretiosum subsp. pretiosum]|uniref:Uncharacterized protein n=2 Tax=Actinosynnema TaxID=40566 RepID=C6WK65_ACTMD|nr:hypothetical protein [Actinosynnema mirum]ACU38278.1 hypothetical protein Amir_4432 [Actinosynnema mirum DSM 43827]AXX31796.1 hypothetical protein APASM_4431 [Actinosynnema pretiosum subsp. pretiosum]QUF04208.1 ABC transporter permease [Actinosynnema pretiosum subsp. pretiosum]
MSANDFRPGEVDNRAAYAGFTLAFVLGHGSAALSRGADPPLPLPHWVPLVVLALFLVPALALSVRAGVRAQRGAGPERERAESLLGGAWCTGFVALALAITGLAAGTPSLQDVLWPAGSVLIVGMVNVAEGAVRRDVLHYALGTWLALLSSASLFLDVAGVYAVLAVAGGGGYALAAALAGTRVARTP